MTGIRKGCCRLAAVNNLKVSCPDNVCSTCCTFKLDIHCGCRYAIDGILLTMADNRTNNARGIIESLRSTVGQNIKVFDTEIPHSVRAAECALTGESIFSHDKNGKVAAAYAAVSGRGVCAQTAGRGAGGAAPVSERESKDHHAAAASALRPCPLTRAC